MAEKHFEVAQSLYGSQNYGLDYEKSDMDFHILVMPSHAEIISNTKAEMSNYEHFSYHDIRYWFAQAIKGNPSAMEIVSFANAIHPNEKSGSQLQSFLDKMRANTNILIANSLSFFYGMEGNVKGGFSRAKKELDDGSEDAARKYLARCYSFSMITCDQAEENVRLDWAAHKEIGRKIRFDKSFSLPEIYQFVGAILYSTFDGGVIKNKYILKNSKAQKDDRHIKIINELQIDFSQWFFTQLLDISN